MTSWRGSCGYIHDLFGWVDFWWVSGQWNGRGGRGVSGRPADGGKPVGSVALFILSPIVHRGCASAYLVIPLERKKRCGEPTKVKVKGAM